MATSLVNVREFEVAARAALDPVGPFFGGRFEDRDHAIAVFEEHNAAVRREVPAVRLLVCGPGIGWERLCGFLGEPVPDEPYPQLNDPGKFWGRVEARIAESRSP